jgi:anti-sigma-K factor RskA
MRADIHTLTGAYVVDALPEDEQQLFEEHLEECDACRQEVGELLVTAANIGSSLSEPPPASLRDAVMAEIDQTRQEPPPAAEASDDGADAAVVALDDRRRPEPRRWWTHLVAPAAAVVAIAVVGLSLMVANLTDRLDQLEAASSQVTDVLAAPDAETLTVEGPGGSFARVVVASSRGEAVFLTDGMPETSPDETYELWLIDEEGPAPAGLFDVDDRGRATRVLTGDLAGAAAIAVTVEPEGGSPQPTSDPLMVVELDAA